MKLSAFDTRIKTDWVAALIIAFHSTFLLSGVWYCSPTAGEVPDLPAGLSCWRFHRYELYAVSPPLVKKLVSLPALFFDPKLEWYSAYERSEHRPEFHVGRKFIEENSTTFVSMFRAGRIVCLPFSLLGALLCYQWSNALFGRSGARLSLTLWCFAPSILGHGCLLTADVPATALGLWAMWRLRAWFFDPSFRHSLLLGLSMGLALCAKFTWFAVLPVVIGVVVVSRIVFFRLALRSMARDFLRLSIAVAVVIYVINLAYGFKNTPTKIGELEFVSSFFTETPIASKLPKNIFQESWIGTIPLPLPRDLVQGIDIQKRDFENGFPSFVLGKWRSRGVWYYYILALFVKVPISILILCLIGVPIFALNSRWSVSEKVLMLVPPLVVLCVVSWQSGISQHMRYAIPAFPYFYIAGGSCVLFTSRVLKFVVSVLVIWLVASTTYFGPHWLSYFNEIAGGPIGGKWWLSHSNIDWGQDLLGLRKWQEKNPGRLHLATFSYYDPSLLGIEFQLPEHENIDSFNSQHGVDLQQPTPDWIAVSVSQLQGDQASIADGKGGWFWSDGHFQYLSDRPPVDRIGFSIYIYHPSP